MLLLGGSACKDDGNRQYRHHLRSPPRARKGKSPVLGRGLCLSGHNQRGTRPDLRNKPRACGATMTGRRPQCVDHVRDLRCCVGAGEPRVAELTLFCLEGCGLPAFDPRATSSAPPARRHQPIGVSHREVSRIARPGARHRPAIIPCFGAGFLQSSVGQRSHQSINSNPLIMSIATAVPPCTPNATVLLPHHGCTSGRKRRGN